MSWHGVRCVQRLTPALTNEAWFPRFDVDNEALLRAEEADLKEMLKRIRKTVVVVPIGCKKSGSHEQEQEEEEPINSAEDDMDDDDDSRDMSDGSSDVGFGSS